MYFLAFRIFDQIALALKKQNCPEMFRCIYSGVLNNLRLPWKAEFPWNFSLYWTIFYHSGFLSNLRLPWKTELPWKCSLYGIYVLHSGVLCKLRLLWKAEDALNSL